MNSATATNSCVLFFFEWNGIESNRILSPLLLRRLVLFDLLCWLFDFWMLKCFWWLRPIIFWFLFEKKILYGPPVAPIFDFMYSRLIYPPPNKMRPPCSPCISSTRDLFVFYLKTHTHTRTNFFGVLVRRHHFGKAWWKMWMLTRIRKNCVPIRYIKNKQDIVE